LVSLTACIGIGGVLFAQTEEPAEETAASKADKLTVALDFGGSLISVDTDGVVDSMTDAGFDEDGSTITLSYDDELWGGTASLRFSNEFLRIFDGEIADVLGGFPLSIDELFVWIKPFGEHVKFTGGVFENTDGLADYTDDIDNFGMGVFIVGEDGEPFSEPTGMTNPGLASGLLTDLMFGPITVQLLLSPNFSPESGSGFVSDFFSQMSGTETAMELDKRFFRFGGRVIFDAGIGTLSVMAKTFQWPTMVISAAEGQAYPGTKSNFITFGGYFDLIAVENLGISLGYTGFLPLNDGDGVDNVLWNGIDLRGTWTGLEGLSLSTHHNVSFAKGSEKDWFGLLTGDSFFTLYNAIGGTKELTEKFSVNAEIANVLSITDYGEAGKFTFDNFWVEGRFITKVTENAEFRCGLRADVFHTNDGDASDTIAVFSIPMGIGISF
ncbi:MAG: hypothetical protein LBD29_00735, partial [Treponema sp.]|nr:hypothetical protein [Treponema sp.]